MKEDADGNKSVDIVEVDAKQLRKELESNQILGKQVDVNGNKGIVIDDTGSKYSTEVGGYTQSQKLDEYNSLNELDDVGRGDWIRGGVRSERVPLRKEIQKEIWKKAESGDFEIINGKECPIYIDGKTGKRIPNYGTHYPETTPLGKPHSKYGQEVPENLIGKPRADIGHAKGHKWEDKLKEHKIKGSTRQEIIDAENKAEFYIIEERSSNRSRRLD